MAPIKVLTKLRAPSPLKLVVAPVDEEATPVLREEAAVPAAALVTTTSE